MHPTIHAQQFQGKEQDGHYYRSQKVHCNRITPNHVLVMEHEDDLTADQVEKGQMLDHHARGNATPEGGESGEDELGYRRAQQVHFDAGDAEAIIKLFGIQGEDEQAVGDAVHGV